MKNVKKLLVSLGAMLVGTLCMVQLANASVAGYVQFVNGNVVITNVAGQNHQAQKGDAVSEGDTLTSALAASAQIKMQDGGFVAIRPDTKLKFDQFVFSGKQDGNEKSFFSLLKGGFRAVTGLVGQLHKQNYRINTPVATIGIRGTDHETFLVVPGSPLAGIAPNGAYSKVNVGETTLTTNRGTINVLPNQMGFAGALDQAPKLQPLNTNIFTVAPAPTPGSKAGKESEKKEQAASSKEQGSAKSDKAATSDSAEQGTGKASTSESQAATTSSTADTNQTAATDTSAAASTSSTTSAEVRSTAVVDSVAPNTSLIQNAVTAAPAVAAPPVVIPDVPSTVLSTTSGTGGSTLDLTSGTSTTSSGVPVAVNSVFATQAQTAADAALQAAVAAQAARTTATNDNATLVMVAKVNTTPAVDAINTATLLVDAAALLTPATTTFVSTVATKVNSASTAVSTAAALATAATASVSTTIGSAATSIGSVSTAVASASALAPVVTGTVSTTIGTASSSIGAANSAVTSVASINLASALTAATGNATAAQSAATAAAALALTAQNAINANGAFADAILAVPANATIQSTNTNLQSANMAVQSAATAVIAQNTTLTAAQTAAAAALATANASLSTANSNLVTAASQNTALTTAQAAAAAAFVTAITNLSAANSNLATAVSQNTALTTAQAAAAAALATAIADLSTANSNLATAASQNTALTTAKAAAAADLATANTNLTAANNQNNAITAAQNSAAIQLTTANSAAAAAGIVTGGVATGGAAKAAQDAANLATTLQAAGDSAGAQAQLTIAQNQLLIAQQQKAAAVDAQVAITAQLTAANTAATDAGTAVNAAISNATHARTPADAAQAAATAAAAVVINATSLAGSADTTATAAQTLAAAAQAAFTAATTAATAATAAANNAATDVATASTQAAAAQSALIAANVALAAANTAATTAANNASTASTQAAAVTTVSSTANAALATSTTNLATVTANASVIATNAPIAAYNNPAIAGSFIGATMLSVPVTGGFNAGFIPNNPLQANTTYVLDGSGNLVEMRNAQFQVQTSQNGIVLTPSIMDADIKWSGSTTGNEIFKLADNSIYAGRWITPTITVTDNVNATNVTTYHPLDNVWAVILPPSAGYVQSLGGTTSYTMAGHTTPVDALGNTGTLNSASLVANFTNQLVNAAVNLTMGTGSMAGTYNVSATGLMIQSIDAVNPSGFGASANSPVTVTCTGTCVSASGYSADLGGSFAGVVAASAGMSYNIWPTISLSSDPASNSVGGLVVFSTTTTPSASPATAYTTNNTAVEIASNIISSQGWRNFLVAPANLTYTAGGLSSFTDNSIGGGGGSQIFSVIGGVTPVTASANSFSITGIQFGRWTSATAQQVSITQLLGGSNSGTPRSWMYGPQGYLDSGITSSGGQMFSTFSYALDTGTPVYDRQSGQSGTLNSATISANFITNMVSASIGLSVGGQTWAASTTNPVSISGSNSFSASSSSSGSTTNNLTIAMGPTATGAVPCSTCYGSLEGAFTGQNYAGAMLSYSLYSNSNSSGDVSGHAALVRTGSGATGGAITNGTPVTPTSYFVADYGGYFQQVDTLNNTAGSIVLSPGSVLTSYSSGSLGTLNYGYATTVACTSCTSAASSNVSTTGIYLGTWDAGSYTNTFAGPSYGSSHWITGPEAGPLFLPNALLGSKIYTFDGGAVTGSNGLTNGVGVTGTVNTTTLLTVNFTKQVVGINIDLAINDTIGGASHNWNAKTLLGNEAVLNGGNGIANVGFQASSYNGSGPGTLTVLVDGTTSGSGNVSGQLTGNGLNGAILSYNLNATLGTASYQQVEGVAAFTSTASDVATPHREVMMSVTDPSALITQPVLGFYADAPSRMLTDANGNITQFDINSINNKGSNNSSMTLASNTSALVNAGSDALTGISWGRWDGGSVNATDRATGVTTLTPLKGAMHWIAGPIETSAVTLPTGGTYSYTYAGGTLPTDNSGNVGTSTATLSANFTAQTVALGVSATVNGTTLTASAVAAPIIQRTAFYADSQMPSTTSQHLAVTCSGTCGSSAQGMILGGFVGAGATGALMSYGLQNISAGSTQVISGVAAFRH